MKKLLLVLAFIAVFALGWGARSWTAHHRGMCGRGHGDHAMMCGHGHHGGHHWYRPGHMGACGKDSTGAMPGGCCAKMEGLDCCEKSGCAGHGKLDSTDIVVGNHGCCKKGACDKRGDKKE